MSDPWARTRTVYDTVAENYAELVRTTGSEAVLDLAMLEHFAGRVRSAQGFSTRDAVPAGSPGI